MKLVITAISILMILSVYTINVTTESIENIEDELTDQNQKFKYYDSRLRIIETKVDEFNKTEYTPLGF